MAMIEIQQLELQASIGVTVREQRQKQPVLIDLVIEVDIRQAAKTEDIEYTVDYTALADDFERLVKTRHYFLVETLAEALLEFVKEAYQPKYAKIKVCKPQAIAAAQQVCVTTHIGVPAWQRKLQQLSSIAMT